MAALTSALIAGMEVLYGGIFLGAALIYSCFQREFWHAPTKEEELALQAASRELWSLSGENEAISHNFITTPSGTQIHYLAAKAVPQDTNTLVVFLHGFPDSAHLFSHQLRSAWSSKAHLVALDLPGCGGSDSLPTYGANQVLNVVGEAILELRGRLLETATKKSRCILVGHDWGGVIGFRLAAESVGLIDEFVAINSLYRPRFAATVLTSHLARGGALVREWKLREAASELRPVFSQIRRSGYTYMLTLPLPLAKLMPGVSRCLVKLAQSLEYKQSLDRSSNPAARRIALAYGPSSLECARGKYGPSVLARSKTNPPGDWDQRVKLYSDGLLRGGWTPAFLKSQNFANGAQDSRISGQNDDWRFHCPVNIIFGLQDVALDPQVAVDGIERHFMAESDDPLVSTAMAEARITRLEQCGHWSILEAGGSQALDAVLARIIE